MKRRLFELVAISASMLPATMFVSCDKDEEKTNESGSVVNQNGGSGIDLLDDVIIPLTGYDFLYACTDTADLSTKLTDFPEKYMSHGSGVESYIYCPSENGAWSKTVVNSISYLGVGFENEDDIYGIAGNHFVVKKKDGVAEYYLKYEVSEKATDTIKVIAPEVWTKHLEYVRAK